MNWKKSKTVFIVVFILIVCCVCWIQSLTNKENLSYNVEVLSVDSNKYGYKIVQNERIVILQPFVPGISGRQYFRSPDDALQVGELVCKRLEAGQAFKITADDLKQLKIKF